MTMPDSLKGYQTLKTKWVTSVVLFRVFAVVNITDFFLSNHKAWNKFFQQICVEILFGDF